jgi:hypothetical protein
MPGGKDKLLQSLRPNIETRYRASLRENRDRVQFSDGRQLWLESVRSSDVLTAWTRIRRAPTFIYCLTGTMRFRMMISPVS